MPDQFGNPTPQEVLAQIVSEKQAANRVASTARQERANNMRAFGQALFAGIDPRLTAAKEINEALAPAQMLERGETESAIDFEIRQHREMFESVRNVDPTTAAQISAQLTELEEERAQRVFLQQDRENTLAQAEDDNRDRDAEWVANNVLYVVEPGARGTTGEYLELDDPDFEEKRQGHMANGLMVVPADQVRGLLDTSTSDSKWWNNSSYDKRFTAVSDIARTVGVANALGEVFLNAIDTTGDIPTTAWDKVESGLVSIGSTLSDMKRSVDGRTADMPRPGDPLYEGSRSDVATWDGVHGEDSTVNLLMNRGMNAIQAQSLLTTMAYTLARSFDARVTEQDYINARRIIGAANGHPALIMAAIESNLLTSNAHTQETYRLEVNNMLGNERLGALDRSKATVIRDQLDLADAGVQRFQGLRNAVTERFGLTQLSPDDAARQNSSIYDDVR